MKIKIERLIKREKETKYGQKIQYAIQSGDKWYQSWEGNWNREWSEGDEVEGDVVGREYQGKTYYDLKPLGGGNAGGVSTSDMSKRLANIEEQLTKIYTLLLVEKAQDGEEPQEDIPF